MIFVTTSLFLLHALKRVMAYRDPLLLLSSTVQRLQITCVNADASAHAIMPGGMDRQDIENSAETMRPCAQVFPTYPCPDSKTLHTRRLSGLWCPLSPGVHAANLVRPGHGLACTSNSVAARIAIAAISLRGASSVGSLRKRRDAGGGIGVEDPRYTAYVGHKHLMVRPICRQRGLFLSSYRHCYRHTTR